MTDVDVEKLVELRALLAKFQKGGRALPWELWTSCSFRRIKTGRELGRRDDGRDVLSGVRCYDGVIDLSMPEDQLEALVEAVNALPALLDTIEALAREKERMEGERAEQWRLRREAQASRDTANAVAAGLRDRVKVLEEALVDARETVVIASRLSPMDASLRLIDAALSPTNEGGSK